VKPNSLPWRFLEGKLMAKELRCRDLGIDCSQVIRADTEEELIEKAAEHAIMVHGIDVIAAGMLEWLKAEIITVD
jgi:predicted small metal-binding protein